MNYYKCRCGEPIEPVERFCLSCQNEYENKYGPDVCYYSIVGYENDLIILEYPKGNILKVTKDQFEDLEDKDLVWYNALGISNI